MIFLLLYRILVKHFRVWSPLELTLTCDAIVYALTVLDSRRAGPLQLEIKKEWQKLGSSTTFVRNQARMSLVTIVEVSKNLSLLRL